jgi:predicted DNA-binding transcriptional regulator AlpA
VEKLLHSVISAKAQRLLNAVLVDLPRAEQLAFFTRLRAYLGDGVGAENDQDRLLERQALALTCLGRIYRHLGRPLTERLMVREYEALVAELELPMSRSAVVRAWGSWDNAVDAISGEPLRLTPRQRETRREASLIVIDQGELILPLKRFLESNPVRVDIPAYNAFAKEWNRRKAPQEPYAYASTRLQNTGSGFAQLVAQARGEPQAEPLDDEYPELVSCGMATRIARLPSRASVRSKGFPHPVAVVATRRLWLRDEVVAFRDREPWPKHEPLWMQDEILGPEELARATGLSRAMVSNRMKDRRWELGQLPVPWVTNLPQSLPFIWRRSDVDAWLRRRG